ncbi:MAG TPA: 2-oxoglutarate dehydrogenase E1 component [Phycisphaerales bacterium]|nr:2-oxoglutarate dehydrogenase E1 component [Phycisphaerales bacterium]
MTTAPRASVTPTTPAVNGWNAEYLDEQYARFRADPSSVEADVRAFFQGFDLGSSMPGAGAEPVRQASGSASEFQANVDSLITNYRRLGHIAAKTDPFGREPQRPEQLSLEHNGLSQADLDREVSLSIMNTEGTSTLRQLVDRLEKTYCRTIGLEFSYIPDAKERRWFLDHFEKNQGQIPLSREQRLQVLEQLVRAEGFERFIQKRYPGEKRFSLEGGESTIPTINMMLEAASTLGVDECVMGMAHRGRLNVLNNVMHKTYEQIFTEFEDNWEEGFADGGGDVKYHRGYSGKYTFGGRTMHLVMASNPSHLESVNAVVLGRCRAKQRLRGDTNRVRVVPLLIHGDAALPGQGVVTESLNYSQLEGYTVGGTIHLVINNQIGFTTIPEDGRSTRYCTDVAKMIDAPVFHVNGDDPEACVAAAYLAIRYRQEFRRDVFIDIVCFRKYGHNEQDEPTFTQPIFAGLIRQHPGTLAKYKERLVSEGVVTQAEVDATTEKLMAALESAQAKAKSKPHDPTIDPAGDRWKGITGTYSFTPVKTGVSKDVLEEVCAAMARVPEGFAVNPKLKNLLDQRAGLTRPKDESNNVSHADAEQLAIGTLLLEGIPVRLSGQDCRRGTFTQRHAVLRDFNTGKPYIPLNNMREMGLPGSGESEPGTKAADGKTRQARFCVYDSPLSEASVMGFDYGYSLADPNMLVMWEGQFGDFVNGAQVMIDQYLISSETKWDRWSGLVLLLPHGYEGAGPEHSSCRIERFLQNAAQDNIEVAIPSTGAQTFHMLRRQVKRNFRKPLIVATPKKMLREFTSRIEELTTGSFQEILDDPMFTATGKKGPDRKNVKKVILCSGKIFHELAERRAMTSTNDVAIVRIEQLYPLHTARLEEILSQYPKAAAKVWVQEEPRNAGCWSYISAALRESSLKLELSYIGRDAAASPATGSKHAHYGQQDAILTKAIAPKPKTDGKNAKDHH